jgi:outer membrane protein OmpA-like peptidoglycan-associated protein
MAFLRCIRQVIATVLFLTVSSAFAQMDSVALSNEYYNQGIEVFGFTHRKQAAELFVLATQMNPKNAKAQLMAGQSIMLTIRKEQSLDYFRAAWKLDPEVDPDILYFLGQAYHYSEKFDSAILFYDRYNKGLARSLRLEKSNKINEVNRKIFECRNAIIYKGHPVNVKITNLSERINSEYPDYAPTISQDESLMVFTSRRPGDNLNERVAVDHEYYEEVFISEKVNGQWQPAKNPGAPLNTGYHNASVNLSPDGLEMIVYHDTNGGDLLLSARQAGGPWSTPKPLDGINTEYLESSATITQDDKTIYFTSNRPGGYGGTDIYSCELGRGGRWTNVKNLGPLVNTEMDEEGVFISASGQHLYFSSNGLAGMGDLDFYRSTFDGVTKEWGEPVNLGYPINSAENDIYFVLNAKEEFAYISSLRSDNLGEQDIYMIDMRNWKPVYLDRPEYADVFAYAPANAEEPAVASSSAASPSAPPASPVISSPATGKSESAAIITSSSSPVPILIKPDRPLRSAVNITWRVLDDANSQALDTEIRMTDKRGRYIDIIKKNPGVYGASLVLYADSSARYQVEISQGDYMPYTSSLYFQGAGLKDEEVNETVRLKRVPSNTHVVNVGYVLNVYFSHDGVDPLSLEGIRNLMQMMKTSPTMRVEIGGHTDAFGPDNYNMMLSRRRAENVRNLMIKGGVDGTRISAVGYGESKPVDANDTMEGRRLNRRIEFTILQP